jgi:hypothetical protein
MPQPVKTLIAGKKEKVWTISLFKSFQSIEKADAIGSAILLDLKNFVGAEAQSDDIAMIVIKRDNLLNRKPSRPLTNFFPKIKGEKALRFAFPLFGWDDTQPIDIHKNKLSYVTLRERFLRPKSLGFGRRDPSLRSG